MPIWGWVCVGLVVLAAVFGTVEAIRNAMVTKKVMRDGVTVVAHVVAASEKLYLPRDQANSELDSASMKIVFTLDDTLSDEHYAKLEAYANLLRSYTSSKTGGNESALQSMKVAYMPCAEPVRLPDELTKGEDVYAASVDGYWSLLPNGYLSKPYVHCKVLVGKGGGVRMIQSPQTDWEPSPTYVPNNLDLTETPAHSRMQATAIVRAMFTEGHSPTDAHSKLVREGYPADEANSLVAELWNEHGSGRRISGLLSAALGLAMAVGGVFVTAASHNEAQARGGGTFTVTIGLILGGLFLFIRGLVRLILGSRTRL